MPQEKLSNLLETISIGNKKLPQVNMETIVDFHFHESKPYNYYKINYYITTLNSLLWLKIWVLKYFIFYL